MPGARSSSSRSSDCSRFASSSSFTAVVYEKTDSTSGATPETSTPQSAPESSASPIESAASSGEKWLPSRSSASATTAFASPTRRPARSSVPRCVTRAAPTAAVSEPASA